MKHTIRVKPFEDKTSEERNRAVETDVPLCANDLAFASPQKRTTTPCLAVLRKRRSLFAPCEHLHETFCTNQCCVNSGSSNWKTRDHIEKQVERKGRYEGGGGKINQRLPHLTFAARGAGLGIVLSSKGALPIHWMQRENSGGNRMHLSR